MGSLVAIGSDEPFVVELEEFSGPLDLLLSLIRQQEIDIADIPIAKIADQFLEAIEQLGLDQAAEYLEMAAQLLRIKILILLPRPVDDEHWEDPRASLIRRLLEYEQIREVVDWLSSRASRRADQLPRGFLPPEPEAPPSPIVVDVSGLLEAAQRLVEAMPEPVLHRVVARPLDVEGATSRIKDLLREGPSLNFRELLGEDPTPALVISCLLAVLELARVGFLKLAQEEPFGDFSVIRESTDTAD